MQFYGFGLKKINPGFKAEKEITYKRSWLIVVPPKKQTVFTVRLPLKNRIFLETIKNE